MGIRGTAQDRELALIVAGKCTTEAHMIADAIAVLDHMGGGESGEADMYMKKAEEEMEANPRVNVGMAVQHLLRAAWYRGYRIGRKETWPHTITEGVAT